MLGMGCTAKLKVEPIQLAVVLRRARKTLLAFLEAEYSNRPKK